MKVRATFTGKEKSGSYLDYSVSNLTELEALESDIYNDLGNDDLYANVEIDGEEIMTVYSDCTVEKTVAYAIYALSL